jgi:hypothetical protein
MGRIVLIHWNREEGEVRAGGLRGKGRQVVVLTPRGGAAELRPLRDDPPEAIVIDLTRIPSQGRAVGVELRRQKGTRAVPLLFAGGDSEKIARIRELLPDAVYTAWESIDEALAAAPARATDRPVVPGTMAGYSGTPLAKKLGIRPRAVVALLGAPEGFEDTLAGLPPEVRLRRDARAASDLTLLFVESQAALEKRFPAAGRSLVEKGSIWIAWPKKGSGTATDLGERAVRAFGLERGFVDYKVCAIDAKWSGLLFTRRRVSRAGGS